MNDWDVSVERAAHVFNHMVPYCTGVAKARGISGYLVLALQDGASGRSQFWTAPICMEGTVRYNDDPPFDARIIALAKASLVLCSGQDTGSLPTEDLMDWQPKWAGGIRLPELDRGAVMAAVAFCGEEDEQVDVWFSGSARGVAIAYLGRNLLASKSS